MEQEKPMEDKMEKKIEEKTEKKKEEIMETPTQHVHDKKAVEQKKEVKVESKGDLETQKAETKEKEDAEHAGEKEKAQAEKKAKKEKKVVKKTEAVARGQDLGISKKHCMAILEFIRGRSINEAIMILERVLKKRQAVPFRGYEIPHRKGKGISEGRYPRNASREMIRILKSLQANASTFNVDLDKAVLSGKVNDASRPFKRGGSQRFKRVHVEVWVKEIAHAKKMGKKLEKPMEVKK